VSNRFLDWSDLGSLTFTPDDTDRVVGSFTIGEDHDTIWYRVISETPPTPWPWSFGIIGWKTSRGYELGTTKAYSDESGITLRTGVGLQPVERTGVVTFEPRAYNLAWIKRGNPWTLTFQIRSGRSQSSLGVVSNSFVDSSSGAGLQLVQVLFP
jgi:hypothetical protein